VGRVTQIQELLVMRKVFSCALLVGSALVASGASAQSVLPLSFEVRGGLGVKTEEFRPSDEGITTASGGVGFGANAAFDFLPGVAVYAGYDRYSFNADIEGVDAEYIDQGFVVGGRFTPRAGALLGFNPWVRGGVLFHDLQLTMLDDESERSTGFEVGGGIDIPLGLVLSFTPGVIYRQYEPDFGDTEAAKVSYFDISLGLKARL
jgi:hypothetical protein